jgi:hypothetical protein
MAFRVTTRHLEPTIRKFTAYGARLDDWPAFWGEIVAEFEVMQDEWWGSEGDGTWKELDEETVQEKERKGFDGHAILVRTGELKRKSESPQVVIVANELTITIDSEYGAYHQAGEGVPQRRIIPPLPRTRAMIMTAAEAHLRYIP